MIGRQRAAAVGYQRRSPLAFHTPVISLSVSAASMIKIRRLRGHVVAMARAAGCLREDAISAACEAWPELFIEGGAHKMGPTTTQRSKR